MPTPLTNPIYTPLQVEEWQKEVEELKDQARENLHVLRELQLQVTSPLVLLTHIHPHSVVHYAAGGLPLSQLTHIYPHPLSLPIPIPVRSTPCKPIQR